ncbi:MAG: Calx-beta domain-containing protein, partial [Pseudomonadota bacterium]
MTLDIFDDDESYDLFIDDGLAFEGADISFVVSLSSAATSEVSVDYAVVLDGDADAADFDVTLAPGRLTVAAGNDSVTLLVSTDDDTSPELNETFSVSLSNPSSLASLVDDIGVGTIINNDLASLSVVAASANVNEGDTAEFVISLSEPSPFEVRVDYGTANVTALDGPDYIGVTGRATIGSPFTSVTIPVLTIADTFTDGSSEQFMLTIGNPDPSTSQLATIFAFTNILDTSTDSIPQLFVTGSNAVEGGNLNFQVSLSAAASGDINFNWSVTDGSATGASTISSELYVDGMDSGIGIACSSADLAAHDGETCAVTGADNSQVILNLEDPVGDLLGGAGSQTVTGRVLRVNQGESSEEGFAVPYEAELQCDGGPSIVGVVSSGVTASYSPGELFALVFDGAALPCSADDLQVVVEQTSGGTGAPADQRRFLTIDFISWNSRQVIAEDYPSGASGAMILNAGLLSLPLVLPTNDDSYPEFEESVHFNIEITAGETLVGGSDRSAIGIISDNDGGSGLPALSVLPSESPESGDLQVIVTLSTPATSPVAFNWGTQLIQGEAEESGIDYDDEDGVLAAIPTGFAAATLLISVNDDSITEVNEALIVTISNPANAEIDSQSAIAKIIDDEAVYDLYLSGSGGSTYGGTIITNCGGSDACNGSNPYVVSGTQFFGNVILDNGAVMTGVAYSSGALSDSNGILQFGVRGDISISNSSVISMSERGFNLNSAIGQGDGDAGMLVFDASGGSHAGEGGGSTFDDRASPSGFDTIFSPTLAGGVGGQAGSAVSNPGGGVISMKVSGRLDLAGSIEANGGFGVVSGDQVSGGSAGGSIRISSATFNPIASGGRRLQAIGGNGAHYTSGSFTVASGGGAGGRIALVFDDSTVDTSSASWVFAEIFPDVSPGETYISASEPPAAYRNRTGAAGTFFYINRLEDEHGSLFVDSPWETYKMTTLAPSFADIQLEDFRMLGGYLAIPGVQTLAVDDEFDAFYSGVGIALEGELSSAKAPLNSIREIEFVYLGGSIPGVIPGGRFAVGSGASSGRLIMAEEELVVSDFLLDYNGTITSLGNDDTSFNHVAIQATNNMNIFGRIDVTGAGRAADSGGPGEGNDAEGGGAAGGSYGGHGGPGTDADIEDSLYLSIYGDLTLGAAGGDSGDMPGGAGGGYIRLLAGNKLNIGSSTYQAELIANGLPGLSDIYSDDVSGSGSGGGVQLLSPSGHVHIYAISMSARGGPAIPNGGAVGGGGGGGRFIIDTNLFTEEVGVTDPEDSREVRDLHPPDLLAARLAPYNGGGGFWVLESEDLGDLTWIFANNKDIETEARTPIYDGGSGLVDLSGPNDELVIYNGAKVLVPDGVTLGLPWSQFYPNFFASVIEPELHLAGEWDTVTPLDPNVNTTFDNFRTVIENTSNPFATLANNDFRVRSTFEIRHNSLITWMNSLRLSGGGQLTHTRNTDPDDPDQYAIRLYLNGNLDIRNNSLIDVSGKGYAPGEGEGAGGSTSIGSFGAAGGGYGGAGANSGFAFGGLPYGDPLAPVELGSGGGANFANTVASFGDAYGGGSIQIDANIIEMRDNTFVFANGAGGSFLYGGGSGGSISISARGGWIYGGSGPPASFQAAGGAAGGAGTGGGSGGRIRIDGSLFPEHVLLANGGSSSPLPGEDGTIYLGPVTANIDQSVNIIEEGAAAVFYITLSGSPVAPVEVAYSTDIGAGASAELEDAFVYGGGVVEFEPGETSAAVTIIALEDSIFEPDDSFELVINGTSEAAIAVPGVQDNLAIVINDNEDPPTARVFDTVITEGIAGEIVVSLSHASEEETQIRMAFDFGPGDPLAEPADLSGGDPGAPVLSIPPQDTFVTFPVLAVDGDTGDPNERNEYFRVEISDPGGSPTPFSTPDPDAIIVIQDIDEVGNILVSAVDTYVYEGSTFAIQVTIVAEGVPDDTVLVDYELQFTGGAHPYPADPGDIDGFALSDTVPVSFVSERGVLNLVGDAVVDNEDEGGPFGYEQFEIVITGVSMGDIDRPVGFIRIFDRPTVEFAAPSSQVTEGGVTPDIRVVLDPPSPDPVVINYTFYDDAARAGYDYIPGSGFVTVGTGVAEVSIPVPIPASEF